jgi:hypothetical protein
MVMNPRVLADWKNWFLLMIIVSSMVGIVIAKDAYASRLFTTQTIYTYGTTQERLLNGVNVHPWDVDTPYFVKDEYFDLLKNSGVQWIRLDVTDPLDPWSGPWFRLFLDEAHSRGIQVLGILDRHIVREDPNFTLDDWKEGVNQVIEEYGNEVDAWEIWNEPNIPNNALGYMDGTPEHYVDILKGAYELIKATSDSPVVFAGLSPNGIDPLDFTSECWAVGAANYCDIFNIHLYSTSIHSDTILSEIDQIIGPKPIWITETGVDSLTHGLDGQSHLLVELKEYFNQKKDEYRIQNVFWYCWMDYAKPGDEINVFGTPVNREHFYGLVTVDFKLKPSYNSYMQ